MEIYLLRHGIAESGYGIPDAERGLTAEGREKLKAVLEAARAAGAVPAALVTSPLRRAVQTGDIAAQVLGFRGVAERSGALVPESSPEAVWREVAPRREARILLVSHEPLISQAVAHLLGASGLQVWMRPATFAAVDLGDAGRQPQGMLKYLLPPPR